MGGEIYAVGGWILVSVLWVAHIAWTLWRSVESIEVDISALAEHRDAVAQLHERARERTMRAAIEQALRHSRVPGPGARLDDDTIRQLMREGLECRRDIERRTAHMSIPTPED